MIHQTTLDDDAPIQNRFTGGGFLRLSGLAPDELAGQHFTLLRAMVYRRFRDNLYFGLSAERGNVWQDAGDIGFGDALSAGSLFFGADTPVGPVHLAYGQAEGGRRSAYLYLGLPNRRVLLQVSTFEELIITGSALQRPATAAPFCLSSLGPAHCGSMLRVNG